MFQCSKFFRIEARFPFFVFEFTHCATSSVDPGFVQSPSLPTLENLEQMEQTS